jgi:TetR/AcrR family transcriptional regulator, fatty acid biosynthesis regulator
MTTRKEAKEKTRRRLLDAMVELLDEEGPEALTTVRITERAGIAQPTFYVHFEDIESALEASAEEVAGSFLGAIAGVTEPLPDKARIRTAYQRLLSGMLSEPRLARIVLRLRRDVRSPFGARFSRILQGARERIVGELSRAGAPRPELAAGLVVGMVLSVCEAVLDGRLQRFELALDDLVHATRPLLLPAAKT